MFVVKEAPVNKGKNFNRKPPMTGKVKSLTIESDFC